MSEQYVSQLVLELRARDVPGPRIGEVVAEVEAHLAESSDSPDDAFGTPGEYAETIAAELEPPTPGSVALTGVSAFATFAGALLVIGDLIHLIRGEPGQVVPGTVLMALAIPVLAILIVRVLVRAERPAWGPVAAIAVGAVALPFSAILLDEPVLLEYPAWAGVAIGAVLAAVGWSRTRTDPVIDPRTGHNRYPMQSRHKLLLVASLAVPVLALLVMAVLTR